jgi:hypothetical protein
LLKDNLLAGKGEVVVGGIRASSLVGVEASNNVVLGLNEVLPLNPVRGKTIRRNASVILEGVGNASRPQLGTSVTSSSQLGVGQEVEETVRGFGVRPVVANLLSVLISVLVNGLGAVPDLPHVNAAKTNNFGVEPVATTSEIEVPLAFDVPFLVSVNHVELNLGSKVVGNGRGSLSRSGENQSEDNEEHCCCYYAERFQKKKKTFKLTCTHYLYLSLHLPSVLGTTGAGGGKAIGGILGIRSWAWGKIVLTGC